MGTRNVDILLRAKDQASKKFNTLAKSTGGLTRSLKKLAIAGAAFVGGRALFRLGKQAIEFAAIQEESDALLIQALKNAGEVRSDVLLPALKQYAAELQRVTKFSNEENEATILLGLSMGITTSKIAEATKAAIGLNSITSGRLSLIDSMKGLALANQNVFTSLERYIPELKSVSTATEKMEILTRKAADGFELAKISAARGLGPLVQMKNALDDMAKSIARPFLPAVQKAQLAVKKWAEDNEEKFASWSAAAALHIGRAKDTFLGFVNFMKNDFTDSMKVVWDSFLILLKAAFDSAVILAAEGGKKAGNAFRAGLFGTEPSTPDQTAAFTEAGGQTLDRQQVVKEIFKERGPLPGDPLIRGQVIAQDFTRISGIPGSGISGRFIRNEDIERFRSFKVPDTGPSAFTQARARLAQGISEARAGFQAVSEDAPRQSLRSRAFGADPSIRRQRGGPAPRDNTTLDKIERGIAELVRISKNANSRIPGQGRLSLSVI